MTKQEDPFGVVISTNIMLFVLRNVLYLKKCVFRLYRLNKNKVFSVIEAKEI
ncbi:hypothetical protein CHS0354_031920, partial [Potamilus streckersoni]